MKYHLNSSNEVKACSADPSNPRSRGCKFGFSESDHFDSRADAQKAAEEKESVSHAGEIFSVKNVKKKTQAARPSITAPQKVSPRTVSEGPPASPAPVSTDSNTAPSYRDETVEIYTGSDGVIHRPSSEGPAIVYSNGLGSIYVEQGVFHKDNGPAVVMPDREEYWSHGLQHRSSGPAVEYSSGAKEYWKEGKFVRRD